VVIFPGSSGHSKSTETNAFVSYLLGGEADDYQYASTVRNIVCNLLPYPTAFPCFEGKTLLIIDTPGYGDLKGVKPDTFVTAAMSEFFKAIRHTIIIFPCHANESRTTPLSPISTYVFSLFVKDIQNCQCTIYTFSDAGASACTYYT
jgi:hypothetical protein